MSRVARKEVGPPSGETNNQDLMVWALYRLDGASRLVDVEEIYVECFALAPARLGWRTRPDLPDYKKCAKALQSVEAKSHVGLLAKQGQYQRRLTREGVEWCERWRDQLEASYGGGTAVRAAGRSDAERTARELRAHPAFEHWREAGDLPDGWWDVADALRCSTSSAPSVWAQRLDELDEIAARTDDAAIRGFADAVRQRRELEGSSDD